MRPCVVLLNGLLLAMDPSCVTQLQVKLCEIAGEVALANRLTNEFCSELCSRFVHWYLVKLLADSS